jgi:hypothetical protein
MNSKLLTFCQSSWLMVVAFLIGCTGEPQQLQPPVGVLSRDSMVQVMASVHIAEAQIMQSSKPNFSQSLKSEYLLAALKSANVDTATFTRSFEWYAAHPEIFTVLYDDILSEITKRGSVTSDK